MSDCDKYYGFGDTSEGFCDQACYCKLGGVYAGAQEQDCETMIWDSSGAAPDAKIAFFDIGDSDGTLDPPNALDTCVEGYHPTPTHSPAHPPTCLSAHHSPPTTPQVPLPSGLLDRRAHLLTLVGLVVRLVVPDCRYAG